MSTQGWAFLAGTVMVIVGLILYVAFLDVETPVVGLRQAGLVIAALGAIEIAVSGWSTMRSRRPND